MQVARQTRPDPPVLDALFAAMKASLEIQREMLQAAPGMWDGPFTELVGLHSLQWLWSVGSDASLLCQVPHSAAVQGICSLQRSRCPVPHSMP